jgi:hypothetical protein
MIAKFSLPRPSSAKASEGHSSSVGRPACRQAGHILGLQLNRLCFA